MPLPPGVRARDFSDALKQFGEAVGKEWVFSSEEDVSLYRDSFSPFWHEEEDPVPAAAVAPHSVEQVQQVLKVANQYKIPLWTISTGRNLGYGGSAPNISGTVMLDLKRMDRVLDVNEGNASCLVEPGVSYLDLYKYIQAKKIKLWLDPPDPGWGSLVGNTCERGGGYTPMRDHFENHCGMEVVLPNGDVVRTGMGALPAAKTWQQYKYGFGPYLDGIFTQSNFGVVTKMGFWLMPEPEAHITGTVSIPKQEDLPRFIDILSYLINTGAVQGTTRVFGGGGGGGRGGAAGGAGSAAWTTNLPFYGAAKVVAAQWEHAKDKFSEIPGATFRDGESYRFPLSLEQIDKIRNPVSVGIPNLSFFGGRSEGHIFFAPIIPMSGEGVLEATKVFDKAFADLGRPGRSFIFPQSYFPRSFVTIFTFPIEHNVENNRKNRELYKRLVKIAAENGYGEYRTHTAFMEDAMETYSFGNHSLRRTHETIKDALDPNGILAPGKNGIWPKRLRKARA
jgi:4-cresol dehydrogenase (hydroxylating)